MAKRITKQVSARKPIANNNHRRMGGLRTLDIVVIVVSILLIGFGLFQRFGKSSAVLCAVPGDEYILELKNDSFDKTQLPVNQCDIVKIVNLDTQPYSIAFGVHEKHVFYPGYDQTMLRPNEYIMVDMVQAGQYRLHDHLRDIASMEISVKEKR